MPERLRPPYDTGDGWVCSCMIAGLPLLELRLAERGLVQQNLAGLVFQWSYRTDVDASAGIHASGMVADVAYHLVNADWKRQIWLECGLVPFPRNWPGNEHGHIVGIGCPHLPGGAVRQLQSYRNGQDGLANPGPYPGPHNVPYRTWQRAQVIYSDLLKEAQMSAADVWNYDIDPDGQKSAKFYIESTRKSVLIIGNRTSAIEDDIRELLAAIGAVSFKQTALASKVDALLKAQADQRADLADMVTAGADAGDGDLPTPEEDQS